MKVNFKKIPCKIIDGTTKDFDMAKFIGNLIYFSVTDIAKLKLAEKIYSGEEVEIDEQDSQLILSLLKDDKSMLAFAKQGLIDTLNQNK